MILILTQSDDEHANRVIQRLEEKEEPYFRFETADLPQHLSITLSFNDGAEDRMFLNSGKGNVDLQKIRTVWYRRPAAPIVPAGLTADEQTFVRHQTARLLGGIWCSLRNRFWVNSYWRTKDAENKSYQLEVAKHCGLVLPRTMITNDPQLVLPFFDRCRERMIYKTLSPYPGKNEAGVYLGIATTVVNRTDLIKSLDTVSLAPCIFQEYVPKKTEIRATVIRRCIFAVEIDSQSNPRTTDDVRIDLLNLPHRPHQLPRPVEEAIQRLMSHLGLVFGCIDLILTPDGQYVFLEINPNGQWLWIDHLTDLPLVESFADLLITGGHPI